MKSLLILFCRYTFQLWNLIHQILNNKLPVLSFQTIYLGIIIYRWQSFESINYGFYRQ